ncbi:HK97 gp10 family phage protein [Paenibacillus aquistagni]|uniref:Bacteriophage HK97-gp10, putative tail-component n=1 Tax=Paenibacillus aquistagni TaxID=1852522 RepID=A0A1X7LWG6_9BACL|nr:HK97 gp10 family phage protein [Paenibacillus aquistagni]NMM52150.1 HK97 gp10 family phage protein [Paenibacillus aquistagni]SMG58211.1 Bacteriophage HK97-gp10, putative tail-component [Paenibacillus aquistagni]
MNGIDSDGLGDFAKQLLALAEHKMPREVNKFMRKEGSTLLRKTKQKARQKVKKRTGKYLKGIKRGKVYKFQGEDTAIRVYHGAPHAHLLEDGHRIVGRDGKEHGFAKGYHVYKESRREFEKEFIRDCEKFIDDMLEQGLR